MGGSALCALAAVERFGARQRGTGVPREKPGSLPRAGADRRRLRRPRIRRIAVSLAAEGHEPGQRPPNVRRWRREFVTGALLVCLAGSGLSVPAPARAQVSTSDELVVLGVNAALGSATAGISAAIHGKPIIRAMVTGAAGGLLIYGGKHLTGMYAVPTLGLPGRAIAAIGSSMIRNGGAGRGPFDVVVIPLGPLTFYHTADADSAHSPVKLNLLRTIVLATLVIHERTEFDLEETMYLGAPVFRTPDRLLLVNGRQAVIGLAFGGSMVVSDRAVLEATMGHDHYPFLVAHERVHVLQDAFAEIAITGPVEQWLIGLLPYGDRISRYVEFGAVHAAAAVPLLSTIIPYDQRPWEREADHFATRYEELNARWAF